MRHTNLPLPDADRLAQIRARNNQNARTRAGTELLIRIGWVASPHWTMPDGFIDPVQIIQPELALHTREEEALLRIVASLLGGEPVDLNQWLPGTIHPDDMVDIIAAIAEALEFDTLANFLRDDYMPDYDIDARCTQRRCVHCGADRTLARR